MKVHYLKIAPEYFEAVISKRKRFEIRKDDREYEVGDVIVLKEWKDGKFTGNASGLLAIRYILRNAPEYGLKKGFCILGF